MAARVLVLKKTHNEGADVLIMAPTVPIVPTIINTIQNLRKNSTVYSATPGATRLGGIAKSRQGIREWHVSVTQITKVLAGLNRVG